MGFVVAGGRGAAWLTAQPQLVTQVLQVVQRWFTCYLLDRAGFGRRVRDDTVQLMMSSLEFMHWLPRPGSDAHDRAVKDCFAEVNFGNWMPGLGRECQLVFSPTGRSLPVCSQQ